MLFHWLFTTSLHWFAFVFSTLKTQSTTPGTESPTGSVCFYSNHFSVKAKKRRFAFMFHKGGKNGRKTIGKVTSTKTSSIEYLVFAWQTLPAGLCWWLSWFLVLYYIFLLTLLAQKDSPCCCILIFFANGEVYFYLLKTDSVIWLTSFISRGVMLCMMQWKTGVHNLQSMLTQSSYSLEARGSVWKFCKWKWTDKIHPKMIFFLSNL